MQFRYLGTIVTLLISTMLNPLNGENIGLLIIATGKYIQFVDPLIQSAEKHFCRNHNVTYYVFTDAEIDSHDNVIYLYHSKLGWPYDTMMRNSVYLKYWDYLSNQDYLFASDSDMLFLDEVGDEILSDHVATIHPGYVGSGRATYTYDDNPESKAYIPNHEGIFYFAGGFFGGSKERFYDIITTTTDAILEDKTKEIIALWHDESHWNRYCIDHPPTRILSPAYCYPEELKLPYKKKLIARYKNHDEVRE